jgi:hypothetical protein
MRYPIGKDATCLGQQALGLSRKGDGVKICRYDYPPGSTHRCKAAEKSGPWRGMILLDKSPLRPNHTFSKKLFMSEESDSEVQLGSPAPDFRLLASNNQQIGLEDFRGKANMVLFFVREYG